MLSLETLVMARQFTKKYVDEHGGGADKIQYDSTAGWNAKPNLVAERGVVYIYSDYRTVTEGGVTKNVPGFKIGDGESLLIDLPFATDAEVESIEEEVTEMQTTVEEIGTVVEQHTADEITHISTEDRTRWDSNVSVTFDPEDSENLVLF